MAIGAFTVFNAAKLKLLNGKINLSSDTFKIALCTSSQALAATFTGSSADCRYADLTGELTTANGYTVAGVTLTSVTLTSSGGVVTLDCADPAWTLTGSITFKYGVIYSNTATNKDLFAVFDVNVGGGSATEGAGTFTVIINASGIATIT